MASAVKDGYVRVGVAVLLLRDGKVLVGKRRGSHGAGSWGLPGGHLEQGESFEECATREVLEETGLAISGVRHAGFTNDVFADEKKHYVTLFVTADAAGGDPQLLEPHKCERWEWRAWDELPTPLFLPLQHLVDSGYRP